MIWGSILSVGTVGTVAAIVGALVVGAYILKLRRRRFEVPFSKLWQRVLREKETTSLWRKLKRLLSLAVQLAFVALLLGAALDPRIGEAKSAARNVVLIIDASASMKALDRGPQEPSRIERAKDEAREVLRSLGAGDAAMLVQMDGQATALSRFESDKANLFARVDAIRASDTPADLRRALQAGADALRGRKNPMIVIFGDGGYADDARAAVAWDQAPTELGVVDLRGIDVRYRRVDGGASDGKAARNVGITAFNVRRYLANKLSYEVLVEAQNFGPEPESVKLTLYSGDEAVDVKTLELRAGERRREIYPDLGGGDDRALRAELTPAKGPDVLPLDDVAYALLPERKKQKVLLVSTDNLYLEGALLLDPNVTIDKVLPAEYPALAAKAPDYDVVVYDGFTPDGTPPARAAIYFDPTPARSPIAVRSELARPLLTDVAPDHPVTRWVTLGDVNIDRSSVFAPATGDVVLARSVREPVVVAGVRDGRKLVVFGFNLAGTDLTLRVAFPILLVNALDWFAGDDAELMTTYRTGQVWSIPVESSSPTFASVSIAGPTGSWKAPVQNGRARFYGAAAGIYQVNADGDKIALAANLANPAESNLATVPSLVLGGKTLAEPPTFAPSVSRHIWVYLILGALVLSTIEWLTYNRRITV